MTHNISEQLASIIAMDNHWEQLMMCFESLVTEDSKYGTDFFSQMLISNLKEDYGSYDLRDNLTNIAITIIKKGQESGQIRNKNNAKDLYKAAAYMFFGYEVTWCIKKGNFEWKKEIRKSLEIIFDVASEYRI